MKKLLLSFLALGISAQAFAHATEAPIDSLKTYNLEGVTVYSTRTEIPLKRVPAKMEIIQAQQIKQSGFNDLTDILKNQSSLDVIQYPGFSSQIGIRGFKPSEKYVTVLVNGIPAGTTNISTLALGGIEQIEILKGPFSSIYGTNAMGGVINIITKKSKDRFGGNASIAYGSFEHGSASVNLGSRFEEIFSFDLNVGYERQNKDYKIGKNSLLSLTPLEELILDTDTAGGSFMGNTDYEVITTGARFGIDFSPGWYMNVYQNLFIGNDIPLGGSFWGVYGQSKKNINRSSTSADVHGQIGRHSLQFSPYYNIEHTENYDANDKTGFVNYENKYYTFGALLQDKITFGQQNLVIGLDNKNSDTQSSRYTNPGEHTLPYNPGYRTNTLGIFGQANINLLNNRLNLSAGARADLMVFHLEADKYLHNKKKTENYQIFNPNVGLKYEFVKGLTAHATYGKAFTAPDAYQKAGSYNGPFGVTIGNRDLKPERSTTYDFGLGYSNSRNGIQVDLTYFHTDHKDLIQSQFDAAGGYTTYINTNKARMSGLEALVSYDFGSLFNNKFSLRTFMNATFMLDKDVQLEEGAEWTDLLYVRDQNITFGIEYRGKEGLDLMVNGRFMGKRLEQNWFSYYPNVRPKLASLLQAEMPDLAAQGLLQHPEAMVFNASAYYHLNKVLTFGVNCSNLFNEIYTEKDGYFMPGRTFMGKIICNF